MERGDADVLMCKQCAQTFSSKALIFTHLLESHDEDGPAFEIREVPSLQHGS